MRTLSVVLVSAISTGAFLLGLSGDARADEGGMYAPDTGTYARTEARAGAGRVGLGALSIAGGTAEIASGSSFGRGFGYPLVIGGTLQLALGAYDLVGVARWTGGGSSVWDPAAFAAAEGVRVERTRTWLHVRQAVEASLVAAGGLTAYFANANDGWRGFGLGLALESGMLLLGDVFAERRGDRYAEGLRKLRVGVTPVQSGGAVWVGGRLF